MHTLVRTLFALPLLACLAGVASAGPAEDMVKPIQDQWAAIKYRQPEKQQTDLYHALAQQAHKIVEANPGSAEALTWEGIVVSSEAGARGGLGALSLVKEAKLRFEEALKINDKALDGSAYTSLATLYAQVPGWPVGFGNKDKAEELFRKSLAINPAGIDANFFYGEYLLGRDRPAEARTYLETALKAAPRPGRELADSGRRQEIQALLAKLGK
ncbi:MAG: tetratricopeptide repeat protein [Polaromonas sp.]|uniref:tetratricopeptide repeat protein n=1 Tax=Polaromonas sp. TaxID=1869339 RepID=UPI0040353D2D